LVNITGGGLAGAAAIRSSAEFANWLNVGERNKRLYFGFERDKLVYVGETNKFARRETEHGVRFDEVVEIEELRDLTRHEAHCVETYVQMRRGLRKYGGVLENKVFSVGKDRSIHMAAVKEGQSLLKRYAPKLLAKLGSL